MTKIMIMFYRYKILFLKYKRDNKKYLSNFIKISEKIFKCIDKIDMLTKENRI
jgi:hypothetical protein